MFSCARCSAFKISGFSLAHPVSLSAMAASSGHHRIYMSMYTHVYILAHSACVCIYICIYTCMHTHIFTLIITYTYIVICMHAPISCPKEDIFAETTLGNPGLVCACCVCHLGHFLQDGAWRPCCQELCGGHGLCELVQRTPAACMRDC